MFPRNVDSPADPTMQTIGQGAFASVLTISNIHCPSCVAVVEDALRPLSDILELTTSIVKHQVCFKNQELETASMAKQELQNMAFEVQYVTVLNPAGTSVVDYGRGGGRVKQPVHTWPLFLSGVQRKHLGHCNECRIQTAKRPKWAKAWAAITRRDLPFDVEKQDHSTFSGDGVQSQIPVEKRVDTVDCKEPDSSHYMASFSIAGMTCASCTSLITSELEAMDCVTDVNINLMTHSGTVGYQGPKDNFRQIIELIENLGYEASLEDLKQPLTRTVTQPPPPASSAWLTIQGMTCASCVTTISSAVQALPFVREINIDLIGGSAKVVFEDRDNIDKLIETIEDLGYEAKVVQIQTEGDTGRSVGNPSERTVMIAVGGFFCEHCPRNILNALEKDFGDSIRVEQPPTTQNPKLSIRYTPAPPKVTIRRLVQSISNVHEAFSVKVWHPATMEERSRAIQRQEQHHIFLRLIFTFLVAVPVLIIGIIYMSLVPARNSVRIWFEEPIWVGKVSRAEWSLLILTTPVMFFGADYFHTRTFKELRALWRRSSRVPILKRFYRFGSMNMLISAGTGVAYISSVASLILDARSDPDLAMEGQSASYFDAVAFLTFFILIGKFLEAYSKAKTGDAIAMLSKLRPEEAILVESSSEKADADSKVSNHIPADQLEVGDVIKVLHGVSPPTDSIVHSRGTFLFDESSLTGESKPVRKVAGDQVFAGTVNVSQSVHLTVTSIGGTSMLDKIVDVVREGQTKRAPVERIADTITAYFVPVITLLAILTFLIWTTLGQSGTLPARYLKHGQESWTFWSLEFAIAVFVVACPCGLGLAAPTALFVGGGLAAKYGILVRGGGQAFQEASNLKVIVFDKTGTLTEGKMKVTAFELLREEENKSRRALALSLSEAMEHSSTHPIATAIADYCAANTKERIEMVESDMSEIPGQGMRGKFSVWQDGQKVDVEAGIGNQRLLTTLLGEAEAVTSPHVYMDETLNDLQRRGQSTAILYLRYLSPKSEPSATSFQPIAVFGISDPIRPAAQFVLSSLRNDLRVQVHMCTGDNPTTALAIASQLGIPNTNVRAGVSPVDKATYVNELRDPGSSPNSKSNPKPKIIAFVGDGTNDTPALSAADVSIALSSGSDVAVSTASFILLNSDLHTILQLVQLAKRVFNRVKLNFFWAAIYNLTLVPVAAGVFFRLGDLDGATGSGWRFGPVWASAAMALSSVSVVLSSLALRLPPVSVKSVRSVLFRRREGEVKGEVSASVSKS